MNFQTFEGRRIENVPQYIRDFRYRKDGEVQLMVGTDSQRRNHKTMISTVIVLYHVGRGGHIIHWTQMLPRIRDLHSKLWKEVEHTAKVVSYLMDNGFSRDEIIVHIDVNPNPRWDSHALYAASKGFFVGMGFADTNIVTKPLSYVAMHVADKAARL